MVSYLKNQTMKNLRFIVTAVTLFGATSLSYAQHHHDGVELHVNDKWKECSFQLDPSLTQDAWHQFTKEAALVAYFRPLKSAKPMGAWNVEFSVLQWATGIDDEDAAWNDTFVHPDSAHWLTEGPRLAFPGLTARVGITDKIDVGFYWTKNPNANYGFFGGQVQYNLMNNLEKKWAASARMSFVSLYGPEDLKLNVCGLDLIASKEFPLYFRWASISPYVGVSTYLSNAHETTEKVNLQDEHVVGVQGMVGAELKLSIATLGVEYNLAKVNTLSFKIGVAF
jgi:hypothetical protein